MATTKNTNITPRALTSMTAAKRANEMAMTNFQKSLDCRLIKTGADAAVIIGSARTFEEVGKLATAKALAIAKQNNLWKENGFKTFEKWAEHVAGIKATQAQNYVKAAAYISDNGTETPFDKDGCKYSVAALVAVIEGEGAKNEASIKKALSERFTPRMTVAEIKRVYKHEIKEDETAPAKTDKATPAKVENTTPAKTENAAPAPAKTENAAPAPERIATVKNGENGSALMLDISVPAGAVVTVAYGGKVYSYTVKLA